MSWNDPGCLDSGDDSIYQLRTTAPGPAGRLPLNPDFLASAPSGHLFGWTQNAGMGWDPRQLAGGDFLLLGTCGGIRREDGSPVALGFHTGHWEIGLLLEAAAAEIARAGRVPFAAFCSDPCDGRTQGTTGMFDSLAFRNDAAMVLRRQIRSLPTARGVLGVATCDKGLPAMMMALAGSPHLPSVLVPGGVTLRSEEAEDLGKIQTIGARFAHGEISLEHAAEHGCRACGSPGGGCQFLGTAASCQVVGEALGLSLPHSALAPSGSPIWLDLARRSARALLHLQASGQTTRSLLTPASFHNALAVHAAFGGSTNLVLHLPAIAHAAGLPRPTRNDWMRIHQSVPRLVDALPNGPRHFATVQVFLAGGVPEVMLHLRSLGLLDLSAPTVSGQTLGENLAWWEQSPRRSRLRAKLRELDGIDPDEVILHPSRGLPSTVTFLSGNLAPEGALVKSTAIDPSVLGGDGVYRLEGPAQVFGRETEAIAAIKAGSICPGQVLVLAGIGPIGAGMPETYQLTSALRYLPGGNQVALLTDARFSGVSTGACIGHISPEALCAGPIGRLRSGDPVRIRIDTRQLTGAIDYTGPDDLARRPLNPVFSPHPDLPADTRLWAALQAISGGSWGGCVYDVDAILARLRDPE